MLRRFVVVASVLLAACASTAPPPVTPVPPPDPAPVEVEKVPVPPRPDVGALQNKADLAVDLAAKKIADSATQCGVDWLENDVACPASAFTQIASDYQAYYSERPDPRHEEGRMYSLPRLGGPTRSVEEVTADLVAGCEDNCRVQRTASIMSALDDASQACEKAATGFAACKTLEKKLAKNVRKSEVDNWVGTCEGRCEKHRESAKAQARYSAELERTRPKTQAAAEVCRAGCRKQHEGAWCGTGLMECLSRCQPKPGAP